MLEYLLYYIPSLRLETKLEIRFVQTPVNNIIHYIIIQKLNYKMSIRTMIDLSYIFNNITYYT